MWRTPDDDFDDWGDSFDDKDPEYWNELYSGPDDEEIESFYETQAEVDENENEEEDEELEYQMERIWNAKKLNSVDCEPVDEEIYLKTNEIIKWLESSDISKIRPNGLGFFVPKGLLLKLADGTRVEIIDWLDEEGISEGGFFENYCVVENRSCKQELQGYDFFKIIDAPFRAKEIEGELPLDFIDDIDF